MKILNNKFTEVETNKTDSLLDINVKLTHALHSHRRKMGVQVSFSGTQQ